ncbi:hypothetical protein BH24ACT15_BH24ACT15_24620 [soil metagenome]
MASAHYRWVRGHRRSRRPLVLIVIATAITAYIALAYQLWLIVGVMVVGWIRAAVLVHRLVDTQLPHQIADRALDDRWRSDDWRGEERITEVIAMLADGRAAHIRRARPIVEANASDLGRQRVALDRLDRVQNALRECRVSRRRQHVRTASMNVAVAVFVGIFPLMAFSDHTPGPVIGQPLNATIAVLASAIAAYAMTVDGIGDKSPG